MSRVRRINANTPAMLLIRCDMQRDSVTPQPTVTATCLVSLRNKVSFKTQDRAHPMTDFEKLNDCDGQEDDSGDNCQFAVIILDDELFD